MYSSTRLFLIASILVVGACRDTTEPTHEVDVESLRLTIATPGSSTTQTVTIASNPGCAVTGGPIALKVNVTHTLTAAFLNAEGVADGDANNPATFRMAGNTGQQNPTPTPPSIEFVRTGAFSGTLTGVSAATGSMFVSLLHVQEDHADWGPCSVPISVSP